MRLFLGLDLSTQGFKALLIDAEHGRIIHRSAVNFGKDLVQYRSPEGYLPSSDPLFRHADPGMWLAALGAALRAAENPAEVAARFCAPVDIVEPDPRADYSEVLQQYAILEK